MGGCRLLYLVKSKNGKKFAAFLKKLSMSTHSFFYIS